MAIAGILKGNRKLILGKAESTYGTDPTPAVAANELYPDSWNLEPKGKNIERRRWGATFRNTGTYSGAKMCEFTCKFPAICGPVVATNLTVPDYDIFMLSAGWSSATSGSPVDTVTYTLDSTAAQASNTLYDYTYEDGDANAYLVEANGCVNDWKFTAKEGEGAFFEFSGMGLYVKPVDVSAPSLASINYLNDTDSAPAINGTLTIGGAAFTVSALELNGGVEVQPRMSIGSGTEGYAGFIATRPVGSQISGKLTMELKDQSTDDRFASISAETTAALSLALTTSAGDTLTIAAPALQFTGTSIDWEQATVIIEQEFVLRDSTDAGDDALTFTFSNA